MTGHPAGRRWRGVRGWGETQPPGTLFHSAKTFTLYIRKDIYDKSFYVNQIEDIFRGIVT